MYCKICGASLTPGEVLCKNCGASNSAVEPAAPVNEPQMNQPVGQPNPAPMGQPNMEPQGPVEQIDIVEPTDLPNPAPVAEPQAKESVEKKDNGKFLVIIGIIVGLLATAVIGYLIYSSLQHNARNNGGGGVIITKNANYSVFYGGYEFDLTSNVVASLGTNLKLKKENWNATIAYSETPEFNKITSTNLKNYFATITDYKTGEFILKTYNGISCLETNIDYTEGEKTLLLLCKRSEGGFWYIEIGNSPYTAYPDSKAADEVVNIIASAKKAETSGEKLKVSNIPIATETATE